MTTETDLSAQLYEWFASPKAQAEMKAYARTSEFLHSKFGELLSRHPGKWVAAFDERVCAHADTLDRLLEILDEYGIPRQLAVVRFLDPDPPALHA